MSSFGESWSTWLSNSASLIKPNCPAKNLCINNVYPYMQSHLSFELMNFCHQLSSFSRINNFIKWPLHWFAYILYKLDLPFISFVVSQGAQEIFKLLPHTFVDPSKLPEICGKVGSGTPSYILFTNFGLDSLRLEWYNLVDILAYLNNEPIDHRPIRKFESW